MTECGTWNSGRSPDNTSMLTLIGILIVVVGFALRVNPLLVVTVAGLATGLAGGLGPVAVVTAFGKACGWNTNSVGAPPKIARARAWLHASTTSLVAWRIGSFLSVLQMNGTAVAMTSAAMPTTTMISISVKPAWDRGRGNWLKLGFIRD